MKKLVILLICLIPISANALTIEQEGLLEIAYTEGEKIGYPETIQGILLQETLAGKLGRYGDLDNEFGKKSYGVMQIRLSTAKFIIKKYFKHPLFSSDEQLLVSLVTDDCFNIMIARIYFNYLMERFEGESMQWSKAVLSYNVGISNVKKLGLKHDPNQYLKKVKWRIKNVVRPFNERE